MAEYSYSSLTESKDGKLIPLCYSDQGREILLHSKYNPEREAEAFAAQTNADCLFFVVLGLAGGYHVEKLIEKCPKAKILVIEKAKADITFLSRIPCVQKLMTDKRVIFSDIDSLETTLLSSYKPALHGNLTILALRQWENIFKGSSDLCRKKINAALKLLAADFSVQSHFGKIWQKNILTNLSLAEKTLDFWEYRERLKKEACEKSNKIDRTAAIIAAGPSLDESIKKLKAEREKYFIIATDTAFSSLSKAGIKSDAVVSIDGQMVSHEHYMGKLSGDMLFVFDLAANPSAIRKVLDFSENVLLAESGHPLAQYASLFTGKRAFLHLDAGSGTVTIAAASLAKKLGFEKTDFFGADFAYLEGRPYARGTYLENKFHSSSNRFSSAEEKYTAIMFRSPTIKVREGIISTEILSAYKKSLKDFMSRKKEEKETAEEHGKFCLKDFKSRYCKDLKSCFRSESDYDENSNAFMTLIPLCAKLGNGSAFLAYLKTLSYTERV